MGIRTTRKSKGNQTYVAVYEKTTNKYTVKWVDEDGTTLIDQKDYEYGAIPKFEGVEPTKAADAQYTYTFKAGIRTTRKLRATRLT